MSKIIYWLGKYSKWIRRKYYKWSNGTTLWGIYTFINDTEYETYVDPNFDPTKFKKDIDDFVKRNFTNVN